MEPCDGVTCASLRVRKSDDQSADGHASGDVDRRRFLRLDSIDLPVKSPYAPNDVRHKDDQNSSSQIPVDRKWPRVVTALVASLLVFWALYTTVRSSGYVDVRMANDEAPAHTLASVLARGGTVYPTDIGLVSPPQVVVGDPATSSALSTASCTTCHVSRKPDPAQGLGTPLDDFHTDLVYNHGGGTLSCLSCHNSEDYDALRGADGRLIAYQDVMQLCAQCHGSQYKDYQHGAHGGMTGYWDLSRGPRKRHNCIDCHDPHAPAFPMMQPTFKPIDRGLEVHNDTGHE